MTHIQNPDTAAAHLAEAEECLRHEDTARMREALERLSASPDCSATHRYKAAKLLAAAGATADAIRFYREAGAAFIDPEADTGRAREAYGEAHALDLQDLDIIFEIARVDRIEGHPRAALAKFTHILHKSNQSHVSALFEAACIYQELGQHDQAVLTLRRVLNLDKSNVQAIINMGQRLQSMGMLPEAVGYFMQAATAAQSAGQMGTCRHVVNLVVGLDPNNQQARRMLAEIDDAPAPADVRPEVVAEQHIRRRDQQPLRPAAPSAADAAVAPVVSTAVVADVAFNGELNELTARSDRMQRKLSTIASAVENLEETVANLKSEMSDREQRKASALAGVVAELDGKVAVLKAEVAELRSKALPRITKIADAKPKAPKATAKSLPAAALPTPARKPDDAEASVPAKNSAPTTVKAGKRVPAKAPTPRR